MKEKQIEEMAKVIKSSLDGLGCGNFNFTGEEISTMFAKALYNAGYRKQEWISVEDRLPENYRAVLVVCESTSISGGTLRAIGSYGGGFWSLADADGTMHLTKYTHFVVTHWMELPEAPRMKGGAE
jgi:hypothetical protein